jgi:hypothetical protein
VLRFLNDIVEMDPDEAGFEFWLNKLNQFDGNFIIAEMVKALLLPQNIVNDWEYHKK